MDFIRNFLVGKESISSQKEFKYAMLRGEFGLIIISISLFYIVLDSYHQVYVFLPWYSVMVIVGTATLFLNRKKYYTSATILQLLLINFLVYLFADVDHPYGGVYFYFIACSITGIILLSYFNLGYAVIFALIPIVLGFIAYTTDLNLVDRPNYMEERIHLNFLINLCTGILVSFLGVYFLIKRNLESETSLLNNEANLIKLSYELKKSEERFALAVEGTKAGIYEWNVKNNTVEVSNYWKQLLGYSAEDLENVNGRFFLSLIHPDDLHTSFHSLQANLRSHQPYQNEIRIRTKHGEYKWFQDSGISKLDEEGHVQVVIGSIIDIDTRKKAEEELALKNAQLAKTNEELDRFVYSASHDMRAPLSSLLGLIFITEKTPNPDEAQELFVRMKERIRVMEGFIKEITDYSRNTRLEVSWQELNIYSTIQEVLESLRHSYRNEKVQFIFNVPQELTVMCDLLRLKIIISNLLSNAIKYADPLKPKQEVWVSVHKENTKWELSIRDNGLGITPDHLPKIFDMFFRASESSEGSGLGLYILKETLNKLGGTITVESELKRGTTFNVVLPLPAN